MSIHLAQKLLCTLITWDFTRQYNTKIMSIHSSSVDKLLVQSNFIIILFTQKSIDCMSALGKPFQLSAFWMAHRWCRPYAGSFLGIFKFDSNVDIHPWPSLCTQSTQSSRSYSIFCTLYRPNTRTAPNQGKSKPNLVEIILKHTNIAVEVVYAV